MTRYALDTNIISYILKNDSESIARYSTELKSGNVFIVPPIVMYEVRRGLLAEKMFKRLRNFENYFNNAVDGEFSIKVWLLAAEIYATLKQQGKPIGGKWDGDVLIAAFCIVNDLTLVTNNVDHFDRIDGLKLVNWKN